MRINIRHKLVLTLLATSLLATVLMAVLVQFNTRKDFIQFRTQQDLQNLATFSENFAQHYNQMGGWQELVSRPKRMARLLRPDLRSELNGRPLHKRPPPHHRRPPPGKLFSRVSLINESGEVLINHGTSIDHKTPIVLNGQTIGWLGLSQAKGLNEKLDQQFIESQRKSLLISASSVSLLALLIAVGLARHFISPLQAVAQGMDQLTRGQLNTRIQLQRQDELGKLAQDFNQLATSLEKHERLRRQWMADTSHELRTPIAILHGEIEAIRDGIRHADDKVLASLHEETQHLSKLINDLNDLSLSDAGALNYQLDTLDLSELIEHVIDEFDTRAAQQGIRIQYESAGQALLRGDSTRLQQLLCNLIENSLRYTDAPGELQIECNSEAHHIALVLEDSSPSPDGQAIPHLFDRFYRAEASRNRKTGGSGLGLAICRNIVEAHQGTIKAYHAPSGGLGISISLPKT